MADVSEEGFGPQMAASYALTISGIQRTKAEMKRLDGAIQALRKTNYSTTSTGVATPMTVASQLKGSDIFVTKVDELEGRVQAAAERAMQRAMTEGKRRQVDALRAAVTKTGLSGRPKGRRGPGRDVTGTMIGAIASNVEVFKTASETHVTGWHGWPADDRESYFEYQEKGTGLGGRSSKARVATIRNLTRAHRASQVGKKAGSWHTGVPAANSLGHAILVAREVLRRELKGLR